MAEVSTADGLERLWRSSKKSNTNMEVVRSGENAMICSFDLTPEWMVMVAAASHDYNSVHNPSATAKAARGRDAIVHGAGLLGLVSGCITQWAGDGATAVNTGKTTFGRLVPVGTRVFYHLDFSPVDTARKRAEWQCDCRVTNEDESRVFMTVEGARFLMPPS